MVLCVLIEAARIDWTQDDYNVLILAVCYKPSFCLSPILLFFFFYLFLSPYLSACLIIKSLCIASSEISEAAPTRSPSPINDSKRFQSVNLISVMWQYSAMCESVPLSSPLLNICRSLKTLQSVNGYSHAFSAPKLKVNIKMLKFTVKGNTTNRYQNVNIHTLPFPYPQLIVNLVSAKFIVKGQEQGLTELSPH